MTHPATNKSKSPSLTTLISRLFLTIHLPLTLSFEAENGIKVEESGQVKQITPEAAGITSKGSYSYTAPDGTVVTTSWVADENGFQPSGAHLPVAPPMPDHVVKLLADLKAAGVL